MEDINKTPMNPEFSEQSQHLNQIGVSVENITTYGTEPQDENQTLSADSKLTEQAENGTKFTESSADVLEKNETNASTNFDVNQENPVESNDLELEEESAEENKQSEKNKKRKKKAEKGKDSKPEAIMSYVKALMGLHYMKNDGIPIEILPGFYLGSIGAAFNKKLLEENKIEHILCCCDGVKEAYPKLFKYKMLKLLDKPSEDITRYFEETSDFIHNILSQGQKVLVHCFAGKSRSVTIMISYLVKHHNMTVDEAIHLIRSKRSVIQPNLGFVAQLRSYEKKLKEKLENTEKVEKVENVENIENVEKIE